MTPSSYISGYNVIEKIHPKAKIPERQDDSIAYDLYTPEDIVLPPGEFKKIPLGFKMQFNIQWAALIFDRSSVGAKGIIHLAGLLEGSYGGEWNVILANLGKETYTANTGDRIAQVAFFVYMTPEFREGKVENKREGFGSTGK